MLTSVRFRAEAKRSYRQHQILVYFVADHQDVMPLADRQHLVQFFLRPYPARRVMGGALQEQLHIIFHNSFLNGFVIHGEAAILVAQSHLHQFAPVVGDYIMERVVDWR